jgi:hypothetical protein
MNFQKEFFVPLIPFLVEVSLRCAMVGGKEWWYYFDSGTLLLTFSVWSLLVLSRVPSKTVIETDDEVLASYDAVRTHFTILISTGFILFGLAVYIKTDFDRDPNIQHFASDSNMVAIATVTFAAYSALYIFLKRMPIAKMIEA